MQSMTRAVDKRRTSPATSDGDRLAPRRSRGAA